MGNKSSKSAEHKTTVVKFQPSSASNFEIDRKTYIQKEKCHYELIVFGYLRQCAGRRDMSIHYDLMRHITTWYQLSFEFTKWSARHGMVACFKSENDGEIITRTPSRYYRDSPAYILSHSSNLVREGVHCWRIFVNMTAGQNGTMYFAISTSKIYSTRYIDSAYSKWNFSGYLKNEVNEYQVDILLDCDNNIMRSCIVGQHNDSEEYMLRNLPESNKGWIPLIHTSCIGVQLRIIKMSTKWYGITYKDKYER